MHSIDAVLKAQLKIVAAKTEVASIEEVLATKDARRVNGEIVDVAALTERLTSLKNSH